MTRAALPLIPAPPPADGGSLPKLHYATGPEGLEALLPMGDRESIWVNSGDLANLLIAGIAVHLPRPADGGEK